MRPYGTLNLDTLGRRFGEPGSEEWVNRATGKPGNPGPGNGSRVVPGRRDGADSHTVVRLSLGILNG